MKKDTIVEFPVELKISHHKIERIIEELRIDTNTKNLLAPIFSSISNLLKVVDSFYRAVLKFENNFYEYNFNPQCKGALLRIGKQKGFLDNTVGLIIYDYNKELFGKFFELVAPRGYKDKPVKSYKHISGEPLGWCCIQDINLSKSTLNIGKIEIEQPKKLSEKKKTLKK